MNMTEKLSIVAHASMQTKEDYSLEYLSSRSSCNFAIQVTLHSVYRERHIVVLHKSIS